MRWKPFKYRDYFLIYLWVVGVSGTTDVLSNINGIHVVKDSPLSQPQPKTRAASSSESVALEGMNSLCPRAVITCTQMYRNVTWWGWLILVINFVLSSYAFNDFLFHLIIIRLLMPSLFLNVSFVALILLCQSPLTFLKDCYGWVFTFCW